MPTLPEAVRSSLSLTEAQLRRVEAAVFERRYPTGATVCSKGELDVARLRRYGA